ncbi:MAG: glycine cleavage system protein GcvH [Verrucomicrobia bacterium]|nr:glycine cleavage system protein GcvH [Verrucomicrobiota bacterium]
MMNVPSDLKYTESHEWVKLSKDKATATVGLTDFAQEELTDIVYLDLPKVGDEIEAGTECAVVESVKAASDIYAPLSGQVTEVNQAALDDPAVVNEDAFGKGWLFKMKLADPAEIEELLSDSDYEEILSEKESQDEDDEEEK